MIKFSYGYTQWVLKSKKLLEILAYRKKRDYSRFIILGAPRTGTTLLHTYLNSHPAIWSKGEILREYLEKGKPISLERDVFKPHARSVQAVGAKIFYEYREDPSFQKVWQSVVCDVQIKVLWIRRKNLLRAFISQQLADQTGHYNDRAKLALTTKKQQVIQRETLIHYFSKVQEEEKLIQEILMGHDLLNLTYEQLTEGTGELLLQVQQFLDVDPKNLLTLLVKQNPEPLEQLVKNLNEVRGWMQDYPDIPCD